MPDIPKLPVIALDETLRKTLQASEAVRRGIATHAEKHAAARQELSRAQEADRQLKPTGE